MSIIRKIGSVAGIRSLAIAAVAASLLVNVAIFDVIGAILWFLVSLFDGRNVSLGACYAVWIVMGVFAGGIHYHGAATVCKAESAGGVFDSTPFRRIGLLIFTVSAIVLIALTYLFDSIWWKHSPKFDGYAPDNRVPTIVYFVSSVCSMLIARHAGIDVGTKTKK